MVATTGSLLQSRKRRFVQSEIWEAAIALFAEKGFEQVSTQQIAEAVGLSGRSFFRYFASKDDLLAQERVSHGDVIAEAVRACPASYSLSDVVHKTAVDVAEQLGAAPRIKRMGQIVVGSPAARQAYNSRGGEVVDKVEQAFAERCGGGSGGKLAPRILAGVTLLILEVAFRRMFKHGEEDVSANVKLAFSELAGLFGSPSISTVEEKNVTARRRRLRTGNART